MAGHHAVLIGGSAGPRLLPCMVPVDPLSPARMTFSAGTALDEAAADLDRAMEVFTELGLDLDISEALNLSGAIAARCGQSARAEGERLLALDASRGCGSRYEEADALRALGELAWERGAVGLAVLRWRKALALYQSMSSSKANEIVARLRAVGSEFA